MLARYCNLDKYKVWQLTIPQLGYYLEQCNEHIEFTVKNSMMAFGMFGAIKETNSSRQEMEKKDGTYIDGYKVANEEDMHFLANLLGG